VNPAALVSIAINPLAPTIALGTTQQFTATGTYTDGTAQDLTTVVTWSSSSATVAIISNTVGSTTVTVFWCRRNLNTRKPPVSSTWLWSSSPLRSLGLSPARRLVLHVHCCLLHRRSLGKIM